MSRSTNQNMTTDLIADAATYTALDELRNHDCDKDLEENIQFKAKNTTVRMSETFLNLKKGRTDADAVWYLPLKRIILGNTVLELKTCEINIELTPVADINDMQMSSIVVDAIIFLNHIGGVQILINEFNFDHIIGVVKKFIHQKQKLLENIKHIKQILLDRESGVELIKRVIILGCDAYEDGIFWLIVKKLYADFDMSQKTLNAAQISAFIGTLVESNGFEELAKLLEPLVEVRGFVTKLNHLDDI